MLLMPETQNSENKPAGKLSLKQRIYDIYDKQYKILSLITVFLLIISVGYLTYNYITTGDLFKKDISLSGGITITIPLEKEINVKQLSSDLSRDIKKDVSIRQLSSGGKQSGLIVEINSKENNPDEVDKIIAEIEKASTEKIGVDYSVEFIGSSLGASFFNEVARSLIIAFIAMAIVVILYFRLFVPSIAVIFAAFTDIAITLAVVNIMGMRIGTAGIAALLMLIGYSVDTDMLLTTRVMKRKEGSVMDRVMDSVKTGMKMTLTTLGALTVGLIFTNSDTIKQIMIIIFIGLLVDMLATWFTNVGILRYYLEKKGIK